MENFPKAKVSAVQLKVSKYQNYINQTSQVQKYGGPTDTGTPASIVKQSSKLKKAEVNNTINKVSKIVTEDNIKVANECSNVQSKKLRKGLINSKSFQTMTDQGDDVNM